jgi:glycosyltransferase involved in cell wall biosynthesis
MSKKQAMENPICESGGEMSGTLLELAPEGAPSTAGGPKPVVSIVLPAYNEGDSLPLVIKAVLESLKGVDVRPEIIVVDDGSSDGTREAVRGVMAILHGLHASIRYVRFSRNFGKEAALSAGLEHARGDAVILMDSDGQHPADLLPMFIERWRRGCEVVCAVQQARRQPVLRRMLTGWYYQIMEAGSSVVIPANVGDFRLLDRKVVDAINRLPERNRFMKGLFAWVGFRTEFIPYEAAARLAGSSRFNLLKLFGLGVTGLTSFSVAPLRLVSLAGVLISATSLINGIYLLVEHYVYGDHPSGWATLSVGMMLLSGIQILCLGVIAEYLGRVFEEVKQRPRYVIAEDIDACNGAHLPPHLPPDGKVG